MQRHYQNAGEMPSSSCVEDKKYFLKRGCMDIFKVNVPTECSKFYKTITLYHRVCAYIKWQSRHVFNVTGFSQVTMVITTHNALRSTNRLQKYTNYKQSVIISLVLLMKLSTHYVYLHDKI